MEGHIEAVLALSFSLLESLQVLIVRGGDRIGRFILDEVLISYYIVFEPLVQSIRMN